MRKLLLWLRKPRGPEKTPNPRSRKRGDPMWYVLCVRLMWGVNAFTAWLIFVSAVFLVLQ